MDIQAVKKAEGFTELPEQLISAIEKRDRSGVRRLLMLAACSPVAMERARLALTGMALGDLVEVVAVADGAPGEDTELRVKRDRLRVDARCKVLEILMREVGRTLSAGPGASNVQVNIGLDGILAQVAERRASQVVQPKGE